VAIWGKLTAEPVAPAGGAAAAPGAVPPEQADNTLPDATAKAGRIAFQLFLVAIAIGIIFNSAGWTTHEFDPSKVAAANFALFAGFYVGAQVIERVLEFVAPTLPPGDPDTWLAPTVPADETVKAAQIKADRAKLVLGVAAILGVLASCLFGLFFLKAIGMHVSHTVDSIVTGITIAAGTKPLHDFITSLQNQSSPTTGTGTT
jgi:hypothetical protein